MKMAEKIKRKPIPTAQTMEETNVSVSDIFDKVKDNSMLDEFKTTLRMDGGLQYVLCGPIKLTWLARATKVSTASSVLAIGLLAYFMKEATKDKIVKLPESLTSAFGICKRSKLAAYEILEKAGLIKQHKTPGVQTQIELIEDL